MKKAKIRNKKEIAKNILDGLNEVLEIEQGKKIAKRNREVVIPNLPVYSGQEVKRVRKKLNVTQKIFALVFGVNPKTVEAWEGNRNVPEGPAQRIFYMIDKNPDFLKSLGIKI
jgi:putative transcriptional regulator